jgi:hypothetical protein
VTWHLRKIKVVDKQESKPSNLHVGAKRKVVDGDYSADSAKRFKSSGPHQKHKSNKQDRRGQSSVSDSFQKKGTMTAGVSSPEVKRLISYVQLAQNQTQVGCHVQNFVDKWKQPYV